MSVNPQDVVDYVRASQAAMRKAASTLQEQEARDKAAAAVAAAAAQALVEHEHVKVAADDPTLVGALASHEKTLLLLTKLAEARSGRAPAAIGEPADGVEKAAAAGWRGVHDAPDNGTSAAYAAFDDRIRSAYGR